MGDVSTLKVGCWNCRGNRSSVPYLRDLLAGHDVLAISEHWLHSNRLKTLSEITSTHSVHARSSRHSADEYYGSRRGQGGVAIFWRTDRRGFSAITDITHDRICAVRYQDINGCVYIFISVYLPSQGSPDNLVECLEDLSEIVETREVGAKVIICGDYNGDIGSYGLSRSPTPPTAQGMHVISFLNRHSLYAVNMDPTTTGQIYTCEGPNFLSTLDYISIPVTMKPYVVQASVLGDNILNTSDHYPVSVTLNVECVKAVNVKDESQGRIRWDKLTRHEIQVKYEFPLIPKFTESLELLQRPDINERQIDYIFEEITKQLLKTSATLPRSKFRKHLKPFWDAEMDVLKLEKIRTYRIWVTAGRPRAPENQLYIEYKRAKKDFMKRLSRLSRGYENAEILNAVRMAEIDKNCFWRLVKKARKSNGPTVTGIKNRDDKVVHEIDEVLNVWKHHFEKLGTPKVSDDYDNDHYRHVSDRVRALLIRKEGVDHFLSNPFTIEELECAIKTLNKNKAPGFDRITSEHIKYAGAHIRNVLLVLYNYMIVLEYVPVCCRTGVQVPLYKGKDTCTLDPNNYRGITLLSVFNKIFEILIWKRLHVWWEENNVVSDLQFACKKGLWCTHAAFLLKETVATSLEAGEKCYVAFYDVAKAFDTVWIDGLFIQLWDAGIQGKLWRMLYLCYRNFRCCVRVGGHVSAWYQLKCGIHQGGYMSLIKYTAFINSLLKAMQQMNICCKIYRTPSAPVGYADDMAACCRIKNDLDKVMTTVENHGRTWRYDFNAKKSGVLVFGETKREHERNSVNRIFLLGTERVIEKESYDHLGVKACIFENDTVGIEERLAKGRRTLNATSGLGIRNNGLTIYACCVIFWCIVMPIATFGSELWILDDKSIVLLESFQVFVGRRIQRLFSKSPRVSAYFSLGWVRVERFIEIKKLLFLHSIMSRDQDDTIKIIFVERAKRYFDNVEECGLNMCRSSVYDLLNTANTFGIINDVRDMVYRNLEWSRAHWRVKLWKRAWELEDVYWCMKSRCHKSLELLSEICTTTRYVIWWQIADKSPQLMRDCETMVKLICHASLLKIDDVRLKRLTIANRFCTLCDLGSVDDSRHMVMECPGLQPMRNTMFTKINAILDDYGLEHDVLDGNVFLTLMGKPNVNIPMEAMEEIWISSAKNISSMYRLKLREGIG